MSRLILLLVVVQVHQALNIPLGPSEQQNSKSNTETHILHIAKPSHHNQKHPILVVPPPNVNFVQSKILDGRQKKGLNIQLHPVHHQLLVPSNLHVIPLHPNIHHSAINTGINLVTNDHINLPIVSHSYSHSSTNVTHSSPLILIPLHTHLVPLHDLTVIPLHRPVHNVHAEPKLSHYRAATDKRGTNEEEPMNRFRYFGGYGNGLDFGGHGAGHGFYTVGGWA